MFVFAAHLGEIKAYHIMKSRQARSSAGGDGCQSGEVSGAVSVYKSWVPGAALPEVVTGSYFAIKQTCPQQQGEMPAGLVQAAVPLNWVHFSR